MRGSNRPRIASASRPGPNAGPASNRGDGGWNVAESRAAFARTKSWAGRDLRCARQHAKRAFTRTRCLGAGSSLSGPLLYLCCSERAAAGSRPAVHLVTLSLILNFYSTFASPYHDHGRSPAGALVGTLRSGTSVQPNPAACTKREQCAEGFVCPALMSSPLSSCSAFASPPAPASMGGVVLPEAL